MRLALILALLASPVAVQAQNAICAPYPALRAHHEANNIRLEGYGQTNNPAGLTVELWMAPNGFWALVAVSEGIACIMATGEGWNTPEGM